ncbi:hypothetical protein N431DRAFT_454510 [Stipitochalara longipes BDJ]|nr:hypothetical protein N431DRAFT_454510 [Stipitochalara longipes BDJ]
MYTARTMGLAFGVLATLPTAFSLGCYTNGPTFDDLFAGTTFNNVNLANLIGGIATGAWPGDEIKTWCFTFAGDSEYHVNIVVENNSAFWQNLNENDAFDAALTEINACDHGSEQNHGDFYYRIDPNNGAC